MRGVELSVVVYSIQCCVVCSTELSDMVDCMQ